MAKENKFLSFPFFFYSEKLVELFSENSKLNDDEIQIKELRKEIKIIKANFENQLIQEEKLFQKICEHDFDIVELIKNA